MELTAGVVLMPSEFVEQIGGRKEPGSNGRKTRKRHLDLSKSVTRHITQITRKRIFPLS
jgi:hypothetical protein